MVQKCCSVFNTTYICVNKIETFVELKWKKENNIFELILNSNKFTSNHEKFYDHMKTIHDSLLFPHYCDNKGYKFAHKIFLKQYSINVNDTLKKYQDECEKLFLIIDLDDYFNFYKFPYSSFIDKKLQLNNFKINMSEKCFSNNVLKNVNENDQNIILFNMVEKKAPKFDQLIKIWRETKKGDMMIKMVKNVKISWIHFLCNSDFCRIFFMSEIKLKYI